MSREVRDSAQEREKILKKQQKLREKLMQATEAQRKLENQALIVFARYILKHHKQFTKNTFSNTDMITELLNSNNENIRRYFTNRKNIDLRGVLKVLMKEMDDNEDKKKKE